MKRLYYMMIIIALLAIGCGMADKARMSEMMPQGYEYDAYAGTAEEEDAYLDASGEISKGDAIYSDDGRTENWSQDQTGEPTTGTEKDNIDGMEYKKIPEKIIKTANMSIESEDYAESLRRINTAVDKWQGYIAGESEVNYSYRISNTLTIRVPCSNFDPLIDDMTAGDDKIITKSINSMDVTEEFMDILTRLKNKREVEKRYVDLLKQARTIEEILEVEERIRVIREEIESREGRLKYLNDMVSYSTVTLELYQNFGYDKHESGFFEKAGDAVSGGWEGMKVFMIGMLYLWPMWLLLIIGLVILVVLLKRRKRKRS
ncbi:MAG: DUF4349 domain-containing protein [Bacteroidetes bacterium]|nr:DUF4349 domain-containing protein [Bacteroidota bacterium]